MMLISKKRTKHEIRRDQKHVKKGNGREKFAEFELFLVKMFVNQVELDTTVNGHSQKNWKNAEGAARANG